MPLHHLAIEVRRPAAELHRREHAYRELIVAELGDLARPRRDHVGPDHVGRRHEARELELLLRQRVAHRQGGRRGRGQRPGHEGPAVGGHGVPPWACAHSLLGRMLVHDADEGKPVSKARRGPGARVKWRARAETPHLPSIGTMAASLELRSVSEVLTLRTCGARGQLGDEGLEGLEVRRHAFEDEVDLARQHPAFAHQRLPCARNPRTP